MKTEYACMIVAALFFGSWPLIVRAAGKSSPTGVFIVAAAVLLPLGLQMAYARLVLPDNGVLWKLVLAGIIMGIGFGTYNAVVTSPMVPISVTAPLVSAMMIIVSTFGGVWFFSEALTLQKILGILLLVAAIFLLRPPG